MADDNKPMKYARYAIGEILLVVIGILIALQINNWNEERKQQNEINAALSQILNDLKQDKEILDFFDQIETLHIEYLTSVSKHDYDAVGLDTILKSLDHYMYFAKNNNGYSSLKESGKISNIDNLILKSSLTNYYEITYENLMEASRFSGIFTNNRVIPYVIDHLDPNIDNSVSKEKVVEKMETSSLRTLVNYQIGVKKYSLGQLDQGIKNNIDLSKLIEDQLAGKNRTHKE
jgi:hypothetical protein